MPAAAALIQVLSTPQTAYDNSDGLHRLYSQHPPTDLFAKNQGNGEQGIGLTNDPTHEDEISGKNLVRIDLGGVGLYSNLQISTGSTTGSEEWEIWGSDSPTAAGG